jgi:hypothetical protein
MKKFWMLISLLVIIIPFETVLGDTEVQAPVYQEGDSWIMKATEKNIRLPTSQVVQGEYEITYSNDKFRVFELKGGKRLRELDSRRLLGFMFFIPQREDNYVRFPLSEGMGWDITRTERFPGTTQSETRKVSYKVSGIENVTTPAGEFRSFKITRTDVGPKSSWVDEYYYSPETKSIIKLLGERSVTGDKREIELLKYGCKC